MQSQEKLDQLKKVLQYTYDIGNNNPNVTLDDLMKEIIKKLKTII